MSSTMMIPPEALDRAQRHAALFEVAERREMVALGRAVRQLRTSKGIGRSALIAAFGIDWDRLAALEDGRLDPDYVLLVRLAKALGVKPGALVGFTAE
jgi:ribosome-binding protein aMBF1 (putative translation factor)